MPLAHILNRLLEIELILPQVTDQVLSLNLLSSPCSFGQYFLLPCFSVAAFSALFGYVSACGIGIRGIGHDKHLTTNFYIAGWVHVDLSSNDHGHHSESGVSSK